MPRMPLSELKAMLAAEKADALAAVPTDVADTIEGLMPSAAIEIVCACSR